LKEDALDHTFWRTRCGRGFGPVVRLRNGDECNIEVYGVLYLLYTLVKRIVYVKVFNVVRNTVASRVRPGGLI
jgi:hypothetical protein